MMLVIIYLKIQINKKLISKIKTKIPTVFNEDIKLFMTLYSLLDKITWEYSISKINESENISILKKHPTMYLYFNNLLAIYRTKNDKFKYWIVKNINLENEIIELIEEKTILKKSYEYHPALLYLQQIRNNLEHGLIPENFNYLHLITSIQEVIGMIILLINSFEEF